MVFSEELVVSFIMIYLNFMFIKQIIVSMFIDTAFSRAERAAGFFTIDLSGNDEKKKKNTN